MDRNSAIGLTLIGAMLVVYFFWFAPQSTATQQSTPTPSLSTDSVEKPLPVEQQKEDSLTAVTYGTMATAFKGEEKLTDVQTTKLHVTFSNKGGIIQYAELRNYKTYFGKPLVLIDKNSSDFDLTTKYKGEDLNLYSLYYDVSSRKTGDTTIVTFSVKPGEGAELVQTYRIPEDGYEIAYSISSKGFDKDDKQNWGFYTEMPNRTDMLLMLTFADHFHWKLGSSQPYSNEAHCENSGLWAGSTIGSEMRMLRALGFAVEKYGDNLNGLNKDNEMQLRTAVANGRPVLLLVNSYQLNTVAFAVLDRPEPGLFQKNAFGTHWISAAGVVGGHNIVFWEYGAYNAASEDFWKTVCGGVVVTYVAGLSKA